jgi:O-antigen/teichoic acid export membrane protein
VFFAANKVLINVLNGLRHMRVYAIIRSLRFVLIPVFIVSIIALQLPDRMLPLALTLAEIVLFIVLSGYIYTRVLPVHVPRNVITHVRAHLSFGLRGMMSGVLIEINTRVDVIMLGFFLSDRMVGIYSFAAILAEGFAQIPIAVRYNVDPLLGEYFSKNQRSRITQLARQIRRVFLPAMILLGLVSILMYPVVYVLLVGTDGLYVSWCVFGLLAAAHIVVAGHTPMRGILLQGGAPGTYTIIILATALNNVVLNALLIPQAGILGAAVATGVSIILEILCIVALSRRLLGVRV